MLIYLLTLNNQLVPNYVLLNLNSFLKFRLVLFSGVCAVVYFVVGIRFDQVFIADTPTPIGEFAVLLMILLFAGSMVWVYRKKWEPVRNISTNSAAANGVVQFS